MCSFPLPAVLAEAIVAKCPKCGLPALPDREDESDITQVSKIVAHSDSDSACLRPGSLAKPSGSALGSSLGTGKYPFLTPPQQADELGRLGPYRVLSVLGAGGMGIVFRGEDPALRRQIALKVMLPQFAIDPTSRTRFLREARTQAAIEHDHIIAIYQVGEERDIPFIAMPLLKGQTLADALKANPDVPVVEAIRIAREMSEGLAAAHEKNLIHRDIKPANIWLESRHRRVKILDFGLARAETASESTEEITHEGSIVGTPSHMSPEQAQGEAVDARTDLFSLGVVIYQMLTAQQPFAGKNLAATLLAVMSRTPILPSVLNPLIPPALDSLTMRLLAKDASSRPASAAEVAESLRLIEVDLNLNQTGRISPASTPVESPDPWMAVAKTDPDSELPAPFPSEVSVVAAVPADRRDIKPRKKRREGLLIAALSLATVAALAVGIVLAKKKYAGEAPKPIAHDDVVAITPLDPRDDENLPRVDPEPKKSEPEPRKVEPEPKKVEPEPKKIEPKKVELELAPPPVAVFDSRAAAEWVLGQGGVVRINGHVTDIKTVMDLSADEFRLTYVWLRNTKADDSELIRFKGCKTLTYLNLSNTQIGDQGVANFKDCRQLTALNLSNTPVTNAGLASFKDCQHLTAINLGDTEIGDSGLGQFKDCKHLTYLNVSNTSVTDVGLAHFKDCKSLTYLGLSRTKVTDAGLDHIEDHSNLTSLTLTGTRITATRVAVITRALPRCEITWDGGVIKAKK